ncbi:MAG: glycosyltransferase family 2 protein [Deltaproteobacteria bacterium]|nr:glycosyltransferase family 2 protein [Deltaproteobacteria bacterium]
MKYKPLVSVIMIFLNAEKFIEEAIESVFAQTYNNWELLLIDDGSTDGSTAIARRYSEKYPEKVRYLEHYGHKNYGKSISRNLGINNSSGKYIALLDADDIFLPRKLEQQVAILDSLPEWYSWTGNPSDVRLDYLQKLAVPPDTLAMPPTLLIRLLEDQNKYPCTCSVLIRRQVFKEIGGFEEIFRDLYDDVVFFAKVFLKAPVFVADLCWSKYRLHPSQRFSSSYYSAIKTGRWHPFLPNPTRLTFLNWLEGYLSEQEVRDTRVWNALRKAQRPYRYPIFYRLLGFFRNLVRSMKSYYMKLRGRDILPIKL